jgi:hypothetical protein
MSATLVKEPVFTSRPVDVGAGVEAAMAEVARGGGRP